MGGFGGIRGRTAAIRAVLLLAFALPAVVIRVTGTHLAPPLAMVVFGSAVVAAAILLMWAAETARADMSGALALALLALIAVLPEYAIDVYFAYTAGTKPEYAAYAAANMTGANRLLVGVGWPLVALAFYLGVRRREKGPRERSITLHDHRRLDLGVLLVAALVAFVMPLTREIGVYLSVLLIALFAYYMWRLARGGAEAEEELVGVPSLLVTWAKAPRRTATALLFAVGGLVVFAAAEPFAEALIEAGTSFGVDRFLLVQWLAPLASEAPELIVCVVFAWRARGDDALGALLSSKVNQWTLLVGTLPLAYLAGGGGGPLPLDHRQVEEVFLTAAQTVLGLAVLLDLRFRTWEALVLLGLFAAQFAVPDERIRMILAGGYLALGVALMVMRRRKLRPTIRALI